MACRLQQTGYAGFLQCRSISVFQKSSEASAIHVTFCTRRQSAAAPATLEGGSDISPIIIIIQIMKRS